MTRATLQYNKHREYIPLKQGSPEKTWNLTKHNKTIRTTLTQNRLKGNEMKQKDRQCMCNITLSCILATFCHEKAVNVTH